MFKRSLLVLGLVGMVGLLGAAASHHGWHHDVNQIIDHVSTRIEKKLELRADQKPAFTALVDKIRAHALERQQKGQATLSEVKRELDKDTFSIDKIAGLAKERA